MFRVYHSNRLETLLERLVEVTAVPAAGPLAPEVVVTQSRGMARWLALGLAERRSIAANIDFVLPATFFWRVLTSQLPEAGETSAFDREVLAWRLMDVLPGLLEAPGFEPLVRYLRGERPELKRYQLCQRIADVFDQYLVYRPEMILGWEREPGRDDDWQARLWRALSDGAGHHRARLMDDFLNEALVLAPERLPPRICIFGIPSLPPVYLKSLAKLAEATEVHLFALNPCLQFWGDIEDSRTIARLRQKRARLGQTVDEDYLTSGNSLLASLGRSGRDFIDALQSLAGEQDEAFAIPSTPGMLGIIQADMLTLQERGREAPRLPADPDDPSLRVHVCHSPLREVEVLHDQLLARFDADPGLRPQDVIVMTPDIEAYAPYIEAVFGATPEARRIPWAIADLSRQSEHSVVQAFLGLLQLPGSRFTVNQVLSLLENPAVLRRYGLEFSDFEAIRHWVQESGIRWGLDAASRRELELPELGSNTWEFGFRRLFLGYAMAPRGERLFQDVLPYTEVEGQQALVLGRLRSFVERLSGFARRLGGSYPAADWTALINELLDAFFEPEPDDAEPMQVIREAVAALVSDTDRAGFDGEFGIDVLREHLRGRLAESSTEQRFLTGRLTFCAMLPMRSLPFRVVALIGMNDGAFPRQQRPLGFDRMAEQPRKGDRSRREEDRYLFLEALISAREQLYISYVGRSVRDNSLMLPSVLVAELLDYVDQAFEAEQGEARRAIVTEHPLQPFSERYFRGEAGLFSYAGEWLPAVAARDRRQDVPPFCPESLPAPAEELPVIELAALRRFFRHPVRAFLRDRLGIWLRDESQVLDDNEPFSLAPLETHKLKTELLDHLLSGGEVSAYRAVLKARGNLPSSSFADLVLDGEADDIVNLAEAIHPRLAGGLPDLEVDLMGADWRLSGWLDGLTRDGLVRYRVGSSSAADRIELWIQHLVLNALAPPECPSVSRLIAQDQEEILAPVENARAHLETLIALYREGCHQPLRFMPRSSYAYAQAEMDGKADPRAAAEKAWLSGYKSRGECEAPEYMTAFRGLEPLDDPFGEIAGTVCGPIIAALELGEKLKDAEAQEGAR